MAEACKLYEAAIQVLCCSHQGGEVDLTSLQCIIVSVYPGCQDGHGHGAVGQVQQVPPARQGGQRQGRTGLVLGYSWN